ncbi:MAG: RimK family alpha-L-glutamate ligase [Bacteroidetes bacterium HGW-Bacteroidetes-4]|jgi:glutathione synthase/RimK-type ligase-like ATP-grasp enzyme/ribosomal protein S18 acetylase RimI-like enzyme|nr:MAG: RimK family alpha-L-glutamate ligase [Bacteroidetes bacterium HGW-Bacteroidetes-4]
MNVSIRKSEPSDLLFLENIEHTCFPKYQQSSRRSLRHSLSSPFQLVFIAEMGNKKKQTPVGSLIANLYQRTLRIYSIGVLPTAQGQGVGESLLNHVKKLGLSKGFEKLSLEALKTDEKLIAWYKKAGYSVTETLPNYYHDGIDAVRMVLNLADPKDRNTIANLIVVDNPKKWTLDIEGLRVISSKSYLSDPEFQSMKNARIFNLSSSYRYQSIGYYVSLLASAREHRAIPNVTTIRDFRNVSIIRTIAQDIDDLLQKTLEKHTQNHLGFNIYFGQTIDKAYRHLGQQLYRLFETPLMHVQFSKNERWVIQKVSPLSMDKIEPSDFEYIHHFAREYFTRKRFQRQRFHNYKYDLAILVNPDEKNPPSCPDALQQFKEAARKIGFYTEFITKDDYDRLSEFDALFIRETTSVNNYTYHFSRTAYAEGLVVIDDPWSILRCSNKIFLDERMRQNKILTPLTWILTRDVLKKNHLAEMPYPLVLKQPDSAFSLGVTKVTNAEEMSHSLKELLKKSDLVIAQEFLPSDFDWRIGMLDQKPLYACKYFMAKDHWQIVNWNSNEENDFGAVETMPIEQVPSAIIKAATKAAGLMGDGLYGVDLKMVGDKAYVIEVNDNPNIDEGIEDGFLKEELYLKIMQSIYNRIEMSRNIARFISVEGN